MTSQEENVAPDKLDEQPQQLSLLKDITDQVSTQSLRLWDSLVNVVFDDKKQLNRVAGKFLETDTRQIEFEGNTLEVVRYPARIGKGEDEKEVFPMKKDYKILEALIKLAVDHADTGFYSDDEIVLTVKASYYRVYQIFKSVTGKATFNYKQIEESIDTLSKSHTVFKYNGLEIKGSLISSYVGNRTDDLKKSEFLITFHPIISRIVLMGGFRESNLQRTLEARDMFTVFLYKKFVHNFKQASRKNSYHFSMNSLLKEVPSVAGWKRVEKKVEKVSESLGKLEGDVIKKWEARKKYSEGPGQKKTIDCIFEVWFTDKFIDEQIRANAKGKHDLVVGSDGKALDYPVRNNYSSSEEYVAALQYYHAMKKEGGNQIVDKIFQK